MAPALIAFTGNEAGGSAGASCPSSFLPVANQLPRSETGGALCETGKGPDATPTPRGFQHRKPLNAHPVQRRPIHAYI